MLLSSIYNKLLLQCQKHQSKHKHLCNFDLAYVSSAFVHENTNTNSINTNSINTNSINTNIINTNGTINHKPTTFYQQLTIRYNFSIKNYMKTFQNQNIITPRPHGKFRVDQYKSFVENEQKLTQYINEQKQIYKELRKKWEDRTQNYYKTTNQRRDIRHTSIDEQFDDYLYCTKVNYYEDKEYTTIHRKKNQLRNAPNQVSTSNNQQYQLVLDIMRYPSIKQHYKTVQLKKTSFSPSHKLLAFGVDLYNNEITSFMIKNIEENRIVGIKGWSNNVFQANNIVLVSDKAMFYTKQVNRRPSQLFYQEFDKQAVLVYQEKDPAFWLDIELAKDGKYLLVCANSKNDTKAMAIKIEDDSTSKKESAFTPKLIHLSDSFHQPSSNPQKVVINHINHFIIWRQTQSGQDEICLKTDNSDYNKASSSKSYLSQQTVIHRLKKTEVITDMDFFDGYIVLYLQENTKPVMRILKIGGKDFLAEKLEKNKSLSNNKAKNNSKNDGNSYQCLLSSQDIYQPSLPYSIGRITPGSNQTYSSTLCVCYFSTPFVYNEGYMYDLSTKKFTKVQPFELTGPKFNQNQFQVKTVDVPVQTGDLVPLTIISKKSTFLSVFKTRRQPSKLILKVYGFYGLPNEVSYDNINMALLENGWTIAYAHVRGGGELGKDWHNCVVAENTSNQGKNTTIKKNGIDVKSNQHNEYINLSNNRSRSLTVNDLQSCVAYLVSQRYTNPSLLFLHSHSAGAITVWSAINKSPHLYKGVVLSYPFLDVLNTLMDNDQPLSASDHVEFGNPLKSKRTYRQIESISPYENIQMKKPYPFVYIIGGENDYRCPVKQLVKFVKRFGDRTRGTGRTDTGAGNASNEDANHNNRIDIQKLTLGSAYKNSATPGILLKIQQGSSHMGSSDISQENYNNCETYAFLDYLIYQASNDCKY